MAIQFSQLPSSLREPILAAEFDNTGAGNVTGTWRNLIVGIASENTGALTRVLRGTQSSFGVGSQIEAMLDTFFENNPLQEVYAIGLAENSGGAQATGSITVSGTATANGETQVYVAGRRIPIAIVIGDTATTTASKIKGAIDAIPKLPVTAGAAAGVVTLTAREKGPHGNKIDLRKSHFESDRQVAGITITIAAMTGGSGAADYAAGSALVNDSQYRAIVLGDTTKTVIQDFIDLATTRLGPLSQIDGRIYLAQQDSLANNTTLGNSYNEENITFLGYTAGLEPYWVWASAYAGQAAASLAADPAVPLKSLKLIGITPPAPSAQYDYAERNANLFAGVSTWDVSGDGQDVLISAAITTYRQNAQGANDDSYLYLNTIEQLSFIRQDWNLYLGSRYPRSKAASDGALLPEGQQFLTPNTLAAALLDRASYWESTLGIIEGSAALISNSAFERNALNRNRFDLQIRPDLVNQTRIIATKISFVL